MGEYKEKKTDIENEMVAKIDPLLEQYQVEFDDLTVYDPSVRSEKAQTLIEAYKGKIADEHDKAVSKMDALFDDLSEDVLRVLTKAPSQSQLATLQTMSLKSSLSLGDIQVAAQAMKGNAIALSALADLAQKHDLRDSEVEGGFMPRLDDLQKGLEEYKQRSRINLRRYGVIDPHTGLVKNSFLMILSKDCTWEVFEQAEKVIEVFEG